MHDRLPPVWPALALKIYFSIFFRYSIDFRVRSFSVMPASLKEFCNLLLIRLVFKLRTCSRSSPDSLFNMHLHSTIRHGDILPNPYNFRMPLLIYLRFSMRSLLHDAQSLSYIRTSLTLAGY